MEPLLIFPDPAPPELAQARRAPFHAVLSRVARYDTGNPLGFLEAAIAFALRDPNMGDPVRELLDDFTHGVTSRT